MGIERLTNGNLYPGESKRNLRVCTFRVFLTSSRLQTCCSSVNLSDGLSGLQLLNITPAILNLDQSAMFSTVVSLSLRNETIAFLIRAPDTFAMTLRTRDIFSDSGRLGASW